MMGLPEYLRLLPEIILPSMTSSHEKRTGEREPEEKMEPKGVEEKMEQQGGEIVPPEPPAAEEVPSVLPPTVEEVQPQLAPPSPKKLKVEEPLAKRGRTSIVAPGDVKDTATLQGLGVEGLKAIARQLPSVWNSLPRNATKAILLSALRDELLLSEGATDKVVMLRKK